MKIFNTRIDNITKLELKEFIEYSLKKSDKVKISKINAEFLHRALKNDEFRSVINESDLNLVDGRGVLWAAKYLSLPISSNAIIRPIQVIIQMIYSGLAIVFYPNYIKKPIKEAIPGVDAFGIMMQAAADTGASVYFFGASQDVLDVAISNIEKEFPNLQIAGQLNGYDYVQNDINPVDEINKTDARLLIVALGSPKQENWIKENIEKLKNIRVAVGEGGTLDRIANPKQKSPKFVNEIGLEWLWRLFFNQSKTGSRGRFGRLMNSVPLFIYEVVKWKVAHVQKKK